MPIDLRLTLVLYAPELSVTFFSDTDHDVLLNSTLHAEEEAQLYQQASWLVLLNPSPEAFPLLAGAEPLRPAHWLFPSADPQRIHR